MIFVKVKLNDSGKQILLDNYKVLCAAYPKLKSMPLPEKKTNENGYSEWQLWDLMQTFGPHIWLGGEMPFDAEIEIPEKS